MIQIGDFSAGVNMSAGGGVSGTPSDPSGSAWWDPRTWTQPAGGTLLPAQQTAPTFSLALASTTSFQNDRLSSLRAALGGGGAGPTFRRPVSEGTQGAATAGTPAAKPTYERAPRFREAPQDEPGIPTAYIVGGAAVAAVAAFLVFRKR